MKRSLKWAIVSAVVLPMLAALFLSLHGRRVQRSRSVVIEPGGHKTVFRYADGQGWSEETSHAFHFTSQGSELMPYTWFLALEAPVGGKLFKDTLGGYGFIYEPGKSDAGGLNPDRLPIGFSSHVTPILDNLDEKRWVGLTCSACHTGAIRIRQRGTPDTVLIIDGGATSADLGSFLRDLSRAVQATSRDQGRFRAFAARLAAPDHAQTTVDLEKRLNLYAGQLARIDRLATPTRPWGPGRVDAFGVIFNRVCNYDLPRNGNAFTAPDAPVSYPTLWYTNRMDHVQWHGEVLNTNWIRRFVRNTAEVTGVFARVEVTPGAPSYASSIDPIGLGALDEYVETLKPPRWPAELGRLNSEAVSRGRAIFHDLSRGGCIRCHTDIAPSGDSYIKIVPVPLTEVGTDDAMTMQAHNRMSNTAGLKGEPKRLLGDASGTFGSMARAGAIVDNVVTGALAGNRPAIAAAYTKYRWQQALNSEHRFTLFGRPAVVSAASKANASAARRAIGDAGSQPVFAPKRVAPHPGSARGVYGYEARPLPGIWASPPYLHNGSVPGLAQLLRLKPRLQRFYAGSLVYDPVDAGFISDGSAGGILLDTTLYGNSNQGHEYGVTLTDAEKRDLIEYLKSF